MNRLLNVLFTLLTCGAVTTTQAATIFRDDFSHGSTTNLASIPGGTATASFTSYDIASPKNTVGGTTIAPNNFHLALNAGTTSGFLEAQALFTTNQVALVSPGDYVEIAVVFTNTTGQLLVSDSPTPNSAIWIGLYNSGGQLPVADGQLAQSGLSTAAASPFATGNCAEWRGYFAQVASNGVSRILTRPVQNGAGTSSANQELCGAGAGSGAFNNPGASVLVTGPATPVFLPTDAPSTYYLRITLSDVNTLTISNSVFEGAGTGGTILYSAVGTASGATFLTSAFDGLAVGGAARTVSGGVGRNPVMDISLIEINAETTAVSQPPTILTQPKPVTVPNGGSAAFWVEAQGFNVTYQWHRNGTNLVDGDNISGATSDMLIISPASAADVASGANGYYVTVAGAGGFSVNSVTNSLSLGAAKNLIWSGPGSVWDLNTSANWLNGGSPSTFNFGDAVTFNGAAPMGVTLDGKYLSPSTVTVEGDTGYSFMGSSGFTGPGTLLFSGTFLDIENANSYTGGTIISNSSAYLYLANYNGIGTGPLTLAKAGGLMEVVPTGSASLGIQGDIVVADDFTIQFDGRGSFAGVIFGNLSGTPGKVLTLSPQDLSTTNRYRVYGANTVYDADLVLNGPATAQALYSGTTLAPYHPNGTQVYNGVISGNGGIVQRAGGTTILNGANTYSGGTTPTTGTIGFGRDTVGNVTSGPIGTGPLFLAPELPNVAGSGTVLASGGPRTIANPLQYPSGTNNLTLIVGGTNALTFTGPYTLNGNDGLGTPTNRTIQINNTALTTIAGVISDGGAGYGLTKTGTGTLALSNTETYSGPTIINDGTLLVNGQLGNGAVAVATNGTLGGTGTIPGTVTVASGGSIAPGTSIGTLTLNNALSLGGNLKIEVNTSAGVTSDRINVSGALNNTGSGTVTVSNLGPALVQGNTFTIFNKPLVNGENLTITGAGVTWTNKLAIDGTIAVLSTVAATPTNINVSVSGNTINLSWPQSHLGWTLESNAVSITSSANWFPVPGSASVTNQTITIDPSKTNVFYRLVN